jgi:hypothetical protein
MARRSSPREPAPETLARYVPSEWPAADDPVTSIRAWKTSALAWLAADPARRLPFGRYGTAVDVLRMAVTLIKEAP